MPNYKARYPEIAARFPGVKLDGGGMTPAQGRLVFHQERLLFGRRDVAADYRAECARNGLPAAIESFTRWQCILALALLEGAARRHWVIGRPSSTGWQDV